MEIISCCLLVFVYFCVVWHKLSLLWQKLSCLWQKLPHIYYISRMPGNVSVQNDNIGIWPGKIISVPLKLSTKPYKTPQLAIYVLRIVMFVFIRVTKKYRQTFCETKVDSIHEGQFFSYFDFCQACLLFERVLYLRGRSILFTWLCKLGQRSGSRTAS